MVCSLSLLNVRGGHWSNVAISLVTARCKGKAEIKEEETWLPSYFCKIELG